MMFGDSCISICHALLLSITVDTWVAPGTSMACLVPHDVSWRSKLECPARGWTVFQPLRSTHTSP